MGPAGSDPAARDLSAPGRSTTRDHVMFGYYLELAMRSLRRTPIMAALMVLAIGMGIGACITTLTVLHVLSGDPLPDKSQQLFYPQLDPTDRNNSEPEVQLTYLDATNLWQERRADRQAIVVSANVKVFGPQAGSHPMGVSTVATMADFFPMFDVPFLQGGPWPAADDTSKARVAVISRELN